MLLHVAVECICCSDPEFPVENSYTSTTIANKGKVTLYYYCNELTLASGQDDLFSTKGTFRSTASPGCAKVSACCFHICLSCAILCPMVPFQYSSSSFLHRLTGPSRSFPFVTFRCDVHRYVVVPLCPAQSGLDLSAWNKERKYMVLQQLHFLVLMIRISEIA